MPCRIALRKLDPTGLVSSTLLNMLVIPALLARWVRPLRA